MTPRRVRFFLENRQYIRTGRPGAYVVRSAEGYRKRVKP